MKIGKTAAIVAALCLVFLAALLFSLNQKRPPPRSKVVIAVSVDPSSAPVFIAQAKGFFRQAGVDVSLLFFSTGKAALNAVLEKKADLATIADTVLMFATLDGRNISSIATIATADRNHRIVALRGRGISAPADLRGRKIGVTRRTSGEYFLYLFLLFQGIEYDAAATVNLTPEEMGPAMQKGVVDAVSSWYPTVGRLQALLGDQAVIFEDHSYIMAWNIVGEGEYLRDHPLTVERVLTGLKRATEFIREDDAESVSITSKNSSIEPLLLKKIWSFYTYDIRLREESLVDLEGQARWALSRYYPQASGFPDFYHSLYLDGLLAVDPAAVTVMPEPPP